MGAREIQISLANFFLKKFSQPQQPSGAIAA